MELIAANQLICVKVKLAKTGLYFRKIVSLLK